MNKMKDEENPVFIRGRDRGHMDLSMTIFKLREQLTIIRTQRDEMATELEKLREHSYQKYTNKRNQL